MEESKRLRPEDLRAYSKDHEYVLLVMEKNDKLVIIDHNKERIDLHSQEDTIDSMSEMFGPAIAEQLKEPTIEAIRNHLDTNIKFEIKTRKGIRFYWAEFTPYGGGTLIFLDDVTDIQLERQKYDIISQAVDLSFSPLVIVDNKGVIETINKAAIELFGYSLEEVKGKKVRTFFTDKASLLPLLKNKTFPYSSEALLKKKDGDTVIAILKIGRIAENGSSLFSISISDITELKTRGSELASALASLQDSNEALLKSIEEKKSLIAANERATAALLSATRMINHDLLDTLSKVYSLVQVTIDNPSKAEKFLPIALKEASSGIDFVRSLNFFIKVETGERVKPNYRKFSLEDFSLDVVSASKITAEKRGLIFELEERTGGATVISDPFILRIVLNNLINNAIKYTYEGKIIFSYELTKDNKLLFTVSDTGAGIPLEKQGRIFSKYFQVNEGSQTGTGLGLSIVKNFTENILGGTVDFDSKEGAGTTFFVKIPCRVIDISRLGHSRKRFLIVMEQAEELSGKILNYIPPVNILKSKKSATVIEIISINKPDVVLIFSWLPQAKNLIRACEQKQIPVVVFFTEVGQDRELLDAGATISVLISPEVGEADSLAIREILSAFS